MKEEKDMTANELSNQIRRFRFENGEMTQKELSELAGVTRQTIIAIEASKYSPSLILAFRIARAFNVSLEEVFQYSSGQSNDKEQIKES